MRMLTSLRMRLCLLGIIVSVAVSISSVECHQNHQPYQQPPPPTPQQQYHQQQQHQQYQQNQQYYQQQQQYQQNQMMNNINKDHVLDHLDGVINKPKEQMSADEQNFYYFKLHDYDNNNMLDGLELVSAFAHNDEHKDHEDANKPAENPHPTRISDDELTKIIDEIMKDEDKNLDGYITYNEFLSAINK